MKTLEGLRADYALAKAKVKEARQAYLSALDESGQRNCAGHYLRTSGLKHGAITRAAKRFGVCKKTVYLHLARGTLHIGTDGEVAISADKEAQLRANPFGRFAGYIKGSRHFGARRGALKLAAENFGATKRAICSMLHEGVLCVNAEGEIVRTPSSLRPQKASKI